jgi:small-conductance mechanosensitive channel
MQDFPDPTAPIPVADTSAVDSTFTPADSADPAIIVEKMEQMADGFLRLVPNIVLAAVTFGLFVLIAWVVRWGIRRSMRGRKAHNLAIAVGRLAWVVLLFVGLLVALTIVFPSMNGASLLQLLGVGSLAIGFAFRDIAQNFLAGLLLLLREPFRVGDQIRYNDYEGTVEAIETRATFLRTYNDTRIIIPNGEIYTNAVRVLTAFETRRSEYAVGIGYGDDIETAKAAMMRALERTEGVLQDPPPDVLVDELAGSTVNLMARWWSAPRISDVVHVRSRVLQNIAQALNEASVDMPFPTQVVLWHDQTEETDGDRTRQREGWPAGDTPPRARWKAQQESSGAQPDDAL